MNVANWDDFNKKNKDKTKAFEDLCRLLFLREKRKSSYEYEYDTNEAGLEFKPVQCEDGKWYGIQCKYFSNNVGSNEKYSQIYKSISDAIDKFKGKLDVIYIYTNGEFKHSCTEEEINSNSKTKRILIVKECKKNNIDLKWIKGDQILDSVKSKENLDLYKLYFTDERELDFLVNLISPNEKTFLNSQEFLELYFENNIKVSDINNKLYEDKFTLILGEAGTGKSLTMKQICNLLLEEYTNLYFKKNREISEKIMFPILIKLKECTNGTIEDTIRSRLNDYNISKTNGEKRVCYLFDGLDEIPSDDITSIINYIVKLKDDCETQAVIVSSRCDSNNLIYLRQINKWNEYKIQDLSREQKKIFFESKKGLIKSEELSKIQKSELINEITDIFSLKLLWENRENIDIVESKIELIEIGMKYLFSTYQKISNINILYPKEERIMDICIEIAYIMQKSNRLFLHLTEVQKIIKDILMIQNPNTINRVIDMLLETCFEKNFSFNISFKHRRIQEYFLYRKIEQEYYENPNVLREINILANREFICNVFLKTSIKRAMKNKNLFKISSLRLLESYLGKDYIGSLDNNIISGDRNCYVDASYKYSERLYYLLATYKIEELESLFSENKLGILGIFQGDNYIKLAKIYHEINGDNIFELIKKYVCFEKKTRWSKELVYYLLRIIKKPVINIYDDVKEQKELLEYFFKLVIRDDLSFVIDNINELDSLKFEILCSAILDFENIDILYNKDNYMELFEAIKKKTLELKESCFIKTKVLFSLISTSYIFKNNLESEFEKYNKNNFWTWTDNLEISIYMAILLNKNNRLYLGEFKFGVQVIQALYKEKGNDDLILQNLKEILIDNNYIYRDALKYFNTRILAIVLSKIDFDLQKLKMFLRIIFDYQSVINVNELLFKIYKTNRELFNNIVNESILLRLEKNLIIEENIYYEEIIDSMFSLGAMYSEFNIERRHELLIKGIESSICRPEYKGENFVSEIVTECIYRGYESYWYDKDLLKKFILEIYFNLDIIENRTENYNNMENLKWIMEECNIQIDEFDKLQNIESRPFDYIMYETQFNKDVIKIENLEKYYKFEYIRDISYSSIRFWEYIINIGDKNKKIDILINNLSNKLFMEKRDCIYIPIMILLKYNKYKDTVWNILANEFKRFGMYNIIKIISLNSNFGNGMQYINHMIKFSKFLTANSSLSSEENKKNENKWFEFKKEEWKVNERESEAYFKEDKSIKITWNEYEERENFLEEWATNNPDINAYKYDYVLYVNNDKFKEFSLVWVDGYRALLPIPKEDSGKIVRRDEYLICRLLNNSVETLNRYMISSELRVE